MNGEKQTIIMYKVIPYGEKEPHDLAWDDTYGLWVSQQTGECYRWEDLEGSRQVNDPPPWALWLCIGCAAGVFLSFVCYQVRWLMTWWWL